MVTLKHELRGIKDKKKSKVDLDVLEQIHTENDLLN